MMSRNHLARAIRLALVTSAIAAAATPAAAQESAGTETLEEVVVTGSRIQRPDYIANSPVTSVTAEQITNNADVTLDTFLNTLPQVVPAGSTASNNPGNAGQSNIDLRGLGANRNLVLIDGRRPMVSASNQTVDLNTIPQALIESIEIITGGAGAAYGADAVAGVVNVKLKRNFEGLDFRYTYSNSINEWDSEDYQYSAVIGGNFADNRGNAVIAFDFSKREQLIKGQRPFAAIATSTTGAIPEGVYRPGANLPAASAVNALFASYGATGPVLATDNLGFNADGTLFSIGAFNNNRDVQNWRYPVDLNVNTRFFPDFYSYNFDAVNLLILPLERRSLMGKINFALSEKVEAFASVGYTQYESPTALAPTPVPSGSFRNPQAPPPAGIAINNTQTTLVAPGRTHTGGYLVPLSNPFIPADLRTLLATRTGDNVNIAGSGATEPFSIGYRTLGAGLRESIYTNDVVQALFGLKGDINEDWRWEFYGSEGRTEIDRTATGNINNQLFQNLLERPDGGTGVCAGGLNPFGRDKLSADCAEYLSVDAGTSTKFKQQIVSGYVGGDVFELPAGDLQVVLGAEWRGFRYDFDPGSLNGPIAGFNTSVPAAGKNSFRDYFGEVLIPILKDAPAARSLDLTLGYRQSESSFTDEELDQSGGSTDDAYKAELSWAPLDYMRVRASYQRAVRAPNFGELFDGGGTFPQFFDPCASGGVRVQDPNVRALCVATGVANPLTFVPLPGGQVGLDFGGNNNLDPEEADTYSAGIVLSSPWGGAWEGLRGSIDYYKIKISDPILPDNVNLLLADCYNYYGTNPTYDVNRLSCRAVASARTPALTNSFMADPRTADGIFPTANGGSIEVEGIDIAIDYGINIGPGRFNTSLLVAYLLGFEQQDRDDYGTVIDYAGSIAFFGEGLGSGGGGSAPEIKANWTLGYRWNAFAFDARVRYIDGMDNRAALIFPGEGAAFTGVPSVTYLDLGATWNFWGDSYLRLGVNNVTDKEPPLYSPNVQSGTDPSLYDVIGRRLYGQISFRF